MATHTLTDRSNGLRVRASIVLPLSLLVVFGGLGIFILIVGFAKGISIAPGVGLVILGLVLFVGIRAHSIEVTEDKLIYQELARKRRILLNEIGQIIITYGPKSTHIRIEVHHISDENKNLYMTVSAVLFHIEDVNKVLEYLSDRGISIMDARSTP